MQLEGKAVAGLDVQRGVQTNRLLLTRWKTPRGSSGPFLDQDLETPVKRDVGVEVLGRG